MDVKWTTTEKLNNLQNAWMLQWRLTTAVQNFWGSCGYKHRRLMFGRRTFSVAGPAAWNSLPDYLQDPTLSFDSFRYDLKTILFSFC